MASWTKGLCRAGQLTEGVCIGAAVHDFLLRMHGQREEMVGKLTGRGSGGGGVEPATKKDGGGEWSSVQSRFRLGGGKIGGSNGCGRGWWEAVDR
jgi:hypothetical protein